MLRFLRLPLVAAALFALVACGATVPARSVATSGGAAAAPAMLPTSSGRPLPAGSPILSVAARVAPVARAICRRQVTFRNCDFVVAVDDDPAQPPNAFQTLDPSGRPVVVFTVALLDMARNPDELAFVLGHEAAHHIAGHIGRRQSQARSGAILAGILGGVSGMSAEEVRRAQQLAAGLAAQQYSKEFELEADALGAEIAWAAGYDPLLGAGFFARLPDPGDQVMGSHPPNAQRRAVVAEVVRRLSGG